MIPLDNLKLLSRDASIVCFPKLNLNPNQSLLLYEEKFHPVMKNKKYNLLKLNELKKISEKERRLGRISEYDTYNIKDTLK